MNSDLALHPSSRLKKSWQFQEVYRTGKRIRGNAITIIHRANTLDSSRFGISAHGFRKAVQRNRIKRIIREFFRLHGKEFIRLLPGSNEKQAQDIIFAVRRGFAPATLGEFSDYLGSLLQQRT